MEMLLVWHFSTLALCINEVVQMNDTFQKKTTQDSGCCRKTEVETWVRERELERGAYILLRELGNELLWLKLCRWSIQIWMVVPTCLSRTIRMKSSYKLKTDGTESEAISRGRTTSCCMAENETPLWARHVKWLVAKTQNNNLSLLIYYGVKKALWVDICWTVAFTS